MHRVPEWIRVSGQLNNGFTCTLAHYSLTPVSLVGHLPAALCVCVVRSAVLIH
jgi:hypothetical protein